MPAVPDHDTFSNVIIGNKARDVSDCYIIFNGAVVDMGISIPCGSGSPHLSRAMPLKSPSFTVPEKVTFWIRSALKGSLTSTLPHELLLHPAASRPRLSPIPVA